MADHRSDGGNPVELPGVQIIYRHGRDDVALFRRIGHGGLLLVADTRFFSDMNVEDMSGYWRGNLASFMTCSRIISGVILTRPSRFSARLRSPHNPAERELSLVRFSSLG